MCGDDSETRRAREAERAEADLDLAGTYGARALCQLCGKRPGIYAGWCSECVSDHDL